jgi:hypothetical protein
VIPIKGRLLGRAAEWKEWLAVDGTVCEAIVPYPKGEGLSMHVFCSAGSLAEVKALRAVAETLRVEAPRR